MQVELSELELRYTGLRARDAARAARMRASLAADGQQSVVTVIAATTAGPCRYVLVDGYLRVAALRALGRDVALAVCVELSDADALIMTHRLDETGRRSVLEDGWLLEELTQHHGLKQDVLAKRLNRSRSWVCRRLALVSALPHAAQVAVREGHLPAAAAMKYLVPLSRDNRRSCERLVVNLGREPVTVREVQRLYTAWRIADAVLRERIELHPRLFLQADEASRGDKSDTELLVGDLNSISAVCLRARRRLTQGVIERKRHRLRMAFREAQRAFAALTESMSSEDNDARLVHPHGDSASVEGGPRVHQDRQDAGLVA